jgi:hypothetical protein
MLLKKKRVGTENLQYFTLKYHLNGILSKLYVQFFEAYHLDYFQKFSKISELSLESFLLHMTTHFPALRRTLLLWAKEAEYENISTPVFDILLNPAR